MPIMKCEECGNDVSTKAATCPKCGAPAPTQQDYDLLQSRLKKEEEYRLAEEKRKEEEAEAKRREEKDRAERVAKWEKENTKWEKKNNRTKLFFLVALAVLFLLVFPFSATHKQESWHGSSAQKKLLQTQQEVAEERYCDPDVYYGRLCRVVCADDFSCVAEGKKEPGHPCYCYYK